MLVVSMGGGLGNQMFEYAFYECLRNNFSKQIIKLDTNFAFPISHNGIELFKIFDLHPEIANETEFNYLTKGFVGKERNFFLYYFNKIRKKLGYWPSTLKLQNDFTEFYPDFFDVSEDDNFYFYGPFANYKYFQKISKKIIEIYKFPEITDENNLIYKNKITNCNSVSIHIRKGDYVKEGIELTSVDFYKKAIEYIKSRVNNAVFFVFSDELLYAQELIGNGTNIVYVHGNKGINSFRDMQLMSLCKHNITANSTFSFWGAYLNDNESKIVISPNLAFSGAKYPFVCDDWIVF